MQRQINYQNLIDLGFKRTDLNCDVHFNQYGYHGFVLDKKIYKKIEVSWESENRTLELRRMGSNGDILSRKPINDLRELKEWIAFFKGVATDVKDGVVKGSKITK